MRFRDFVNRKNDDCDKKQCDSHNLPPVCGGGFPQIGLRNVAAIIMNDMRLKTGSISGSSICENFHVYYNT